MLFKGEFVLILGGLNTGILLYFFIHVYLFIYFIPLTYLYNVVHYLFREDPENIGGIQFKNSLTYSLSLRTSVKHVIGAKLVAYGRVAIHCATSFISTFSVALADRQSHQQADL